MSRTNFTNSQHYIHVYIQYKCGVTKYKVYVFEVKNWDNDEVYQAFSQLCTEYTLEMFENASNKKT